ncbi:MAG: PKD domain-containing protein [Candidatus Pacebacteria bacterium]|nr:PKD domain-containing protein [Candidatus Paceibacterota bacterium]
MKNFNWIFVLILLVIVACQKTDNEDIKPSINPLKISIKNGENLMENSDTIAVGRAIIISAEIENPDNYIFTWDMGNGDVLHGQTIAYKYDRVGTYNIILTANDGVNYYEDVFTLVVSFEGEVFELWNIYYSGLTGKYRYYFKFLQSAVPYPALLSKPYFRMGSDYPSFWDFTDTYYHQIGYQKFYVDVWDGVYGQAFGGRSEENEPIFGQMNLSEWFDPETGYLKFALYNGEVLDPGNWTPEIFGDIGDENGPVRITVNENELIFYMQVKGNYNTPWQPTYYYSYNNFQTQETNYCDWIGSTGWIKGEIPIDPSGTYYLKVKIDGINNAHLQIEESMFWDNNLNCYYFQIYGK